MAAWKGEFSLGVSAFRESRLDDALEHFTNAISQGGSTSHIVLDSRAAVLEKLGRIADALKDSREAIKVAPQAVHGYIRSARLFKRANRLPSALAMAEHAKQLVSPLDGKRKAETESLLQEIHSLREAQRQRESRTRCHIGLLPVELLFNIFELAIHPNAWYMAVQVSRVCRHWRAVALQSPSLWRHVVFSHRKPKSKGRVWRERSKSALLDVVIRGEKMSDIEWGDLIYVELDKCGPGSWNSLDLRASPPMLSPAFKRLELHGLGIRALSLSSYEPMTLGLSSIWHAPVDPESTDEDSVSKPTSRLQSLKLTSIAVQWSGINAQSITSLEFRDVPSQSTPTTPDLISMLTSLPLLETFILDIRTRQPLRTADMGDLPVHTCSLLKTLHLSGSFDHILFKAILLPQLQSFVIRKNMLTEASWILNEILLPGNNTTLTELRLGSCRINLTTLVRFMPRLVNLRVLEVSGTNNKVGDLIHILAGKEPHDNSSTPIMPPKTGGGGTTKIPCPALEVVDFSRCETLTGSSLRDLVKVRMPLERALVTGTGAVIGTGTDAGVEENVFSPPTSTTDLRPGGHEAPVPIRSMTINDCPQVEQALIPWLRASVPTLRHAFTADKTQRKRPRQY
ncbi:hypothetical protein BOTBODRAFT_142974 [Botryobasidium botryosum FD-172 SS1]|uniref:F-box domain-containing protein n=1 Tax=Botryobasidium botryosum (strain FD-172 SS1) TaxID=930990 RepID=A0A067MUK9_BOTB1|nr:hypothetical protein BOTBODRAFT_142974 [Botryobasidium botryosum FD-172 SS1]